MKNSIVLFLVMFLFGCATKSDIVSLQSQIVEIKKENSEIAMSLIETQASTSVADMNFYSAVYHNSKALDSWEQADKKLNRIFKK